MRHEFQTQNTPVLGSGVQLDLYQQKRPEKEADWFLQIRARVRIPTPTVKTWISLRRYVTSGDRRRLGDAGLGQSGAAVADLGHGTQPGTVLRHVRHALLVAVVPAVYAPHPCRVNRQKNVKNRMNTFSLTEHLLPSMDIKDRQDPIPIDFSALIFSLFFCICRNNAGYPYIQQVPQFSTLSIWQHTQQVRLVSVNAERPNHPSRCHQAGGGVVHWQSRSA